MGQSKTANGCRESNKKWSNTATRKARNKTPPNKHEGARNNRLSLRVTTRLQWLPPLDAVIHIFFCGFRRLVIKFVHGPPARVSERGPRPLVARGMTTTKRPAVRRCRGTPGDTGPEYDEVASRQRKGGRTTATMQVCGGAVGREGMIKAGVTSIYHCAVADLERGE